MRMTNFFSNILFCEGLTVKATHIMFTFTINLKYCFVFITNVTQIQVAIYSKTSVLWKQHGRCKTLNLKRKVYMQGKTDTHIMSASSESTSDLYLYAFVPALLICAYRKQNHPHPNIITFIFLYKSISRHPSPESHNAHISCSIHRADSLWNNMTCISSRYLDYTIWSRQEEW